MIDLNDYFYFVHVVEQRGFSPAARLLDLPKSRLSRHINHLEERLGVRLLQRSSRKFAITETGQAFYERARIMLNEVEAAEAAVKRQTNVLSGRIRISCSVTVAQFLLKDLIAQFLREHPKVDIIQQVTNQNVDLVESGIDLAIRGHHEALPDSSLIQRKLIATPWHVFAGPLYLEKAGTPTLPQDLSNHSGLKLGWQPASGHWNLHHANGIQASIPFSPRLSSDDMETLKHAAIQGLGIVALPAYICRTEIASGFLHRILPEWTAGNAELSILMPSRYGVMPAVKALMEFLIQQVPGVLSR